MDRIAVIDIGTNTFRMLIAEREKVGGFVPVLLEREIVRLGEGYTLSSRISPEAIARAIKTLKAFTCKIKENGVIHYSAVATGVVRSAENAPEFIEEVKTKCGLSVEVISGEREALLVLKGVEHVFPYANREGEWIIFDIGGGSTELIYCSEGRVNTIESIDLGVVTLSDWINYDPPLMEELKAIEAQVENIFKKIGEKIKSRSKGIKFSLIGTAGTITTLAAMEQGLLKYQPAKINGFVLRKNSIKNMFNHMVILKEKEREKLTGLEKGRGKVIIPGCVILIKIMEMFQAESVSVSDSGLLEGITIELIDSLDNPTQLG